VLLKVKDFKLKNRKMCEEWKGPFIITIVFPNKTALIKTKFGKHEVMYNFDMLKHYHEEEVKKIAKTPEEAEKDLNPELPKQTYSKRNVEIRPDGGPVTRSKSVQLQQQQTNGAKIS
jgi:phage terminase small subunit